MASNVFIRSIDKLEQFELMAFSAKMNAKNPMQICANIDMRARERDTKRDFLFFCLLVKIRCIFHVSFDWRDR